MAKLSSAIDDFGRLLLGKLEAESAGTATNLQISPLGVATVLSMLTSGSAAETLDEICKTLHFDSERLESEVYAAFEEAIKAFQQLNSGEGNELQVANAIVIQNNFTVLPSFLKVIEEQFNSKQQSVDFANNGKQAVEEINSWVREKTRKKIEKLFDKALSPDTRMVLLNAIYFKGKWAFPFDTLDTYSEPFHYSKDESVEVPMMRLKRCFKFGHFEGAGKVVEIPYAGEELYMLAFLPTLDWNNSKCLSEQFSSVLHSPAYQTSLRPLTLELLLPRFSIQSNFSLASSLQQLGIKAAFNPANANFSRINGQSSLFLADVVHKTMIEVNEEGSVAAAVTGAKIVKKCLPPQLVFNRPFLYAIRHRHTEMTLFLGVVNKP